MNVTDLNLPWIATTMKGWGDSTCVGPKDMSKPVLVMVREDAFYTEYPRTEDGGVICSSAEAKKAGLYVATPEIRAEVMQRESDAATFLVNAVNSHEKLVEALKAAKVALENAEPIMKQYPEPNMRHIKAFNLVEQALGAAGEK